MVSRAKKPPAQLALLVHPNMNFLSGLQRAFSSRGVMAVACRDLPTALLALSQHDFEAAVIHSKITEEGDGWSLSAIARRIFPDAHISVTCTEKDVAALQSAINNRLNQIFEESVQGEQIADAILGKLEGASSAQVH
jgi:ActR/RegA family two-component response regulator